MSKKKLNWALLSTARINDKIIPAIKKSKYANLYAVASRSGKNLSKYAKKRNIPIFYNSYTKLLKDKKLDVISSHTNWIHIHFKEKNSQAIKILLKHNVLFKRDTKIPYDERDDFIRISICPNMSQMSFFKELYNLIAN